MLRRLFCQAVRSVPIRLWHSDCRGTQSACLLYHYTRQLAERNSRRGALISEKGSVYPTAPADGHITKQAAAQSTAPGIDGDDRAAAGFFHGKDPECPGLWPGFFPVDPQKCAMV